MTTMRLLFASALLASQLVGCASQAPITASSSDRPCLSNFTTTGSFLTGESFSSFEERSGRKKAEVYERTLRSLATRGYHVTNSNRDLGLISATNPIILGEGSTATLNLMVTNVQDRVRVETTFAIPGLTMTSTSAVREEFCTILGQAFSTT